jgi:predicted enzyme related to lactoylglutathione lyase
MARASCNPVVHLELHTRDSAHACELYRELCGWRPRRIEAAGRSYLALELGSEVGGGVVECDTGRPLWLPYVEVADVAVATDRASELGATVLLAPREGPAGWRSVIATPAGGEVAFWQAKRSR